MLSRERSESAETSPKRSSNRMRSFDFAQDDELYRSNATLYSAFRIPHSELI